MPDQDPLKYFGSEVKRLNYYNSQFLVEKDFNDEQLYHNQMRRLHNRALHTWGVVRGLEVSSADGSTQVVVTPGVAIDRLGREVVLPSQPDPIGLGGFDANSNVYVTIGYADVFDPADKDEKATQTTDTYYKRWTERPKVSASATAPAADAPEVLLAVVALDRNKAGTVDRSVRRYAGSRFGSGDDGEEFSLYADASGAWHFYDAGKGADRLTVDAKGGLGIGTGKPLSRLHIHGDYLNQGTGGITLDASDSADPELYVLRINPFSPGRNMVGYQFQTKSVAGGTNVPLTFDHEGKVGVGTTNPAARLHVGSGSLQIGTAGDFVTRIDGSITHWYQGEENPRYTLGRDLLAQGCAGIGFAPWKDSIQKGGAAVGIPAYRALGLYTSDGSVLAERVRIDSSGNVGVGTTNPISQLHIRKDAVAKLGPVLTLMNGGGSGGAGAAIDFDGYDPSVQSGYDPLTGSPTARIQSVDDGSFSSALLFLSKKPGANGNELQERVRITSAGNVGVGTTNPLGPLSVGDSSVAGSDGYIVIGKKSTTGGTRHFRIGFDADFNFTLGDYGNSNNAGNWLSPLAINYSAPSKSLYINSKGKVGLGTTDIGDKSQLKIASGNDFAHFEFSSAGAGELRFVGWDSGWNINAQTAGKHLYLNRDANDNSDVIIGHAGRELTVKGDTGNVNVSGRVTRKGQDFSSTGTATHGGNIRVPWGTINDWNIFISPRTIGFQESSAEGDNALLVIDCYASPNADNVSWRVVARFRHRWSDRDVTWSDERAAPAGTVNLTVNYLLVPR